MPADQSVLEVNRQSIAETRIATVPTNELDAGQVRLRVDSFALTANNITYAVFGDVLAYWEFFPRFDDEAAVWGRVPAMGWAEIVESKHDDLPVGHRYYGWFPMAEEVVFTAMPTADGFRDDGEHRQPHAPVYRSYVDVTTDKMYDGSEGGEDRHALLRGLVLTGFLAEEFFADSGGADTAPYFDAAQVIVLSASSKTAIGFAQRAQVRNGIRVIGATSPGNVDFVTSLGYYDEVVPYDDISTLAADVPTVSIDMAGNPGVLSAVHNHYGDQLLYSMTVGRSHHDAPDVTEPGAPLPGPQPQLFFAPSEVSRRMESWGRESYQQRTADALSVFVEGSRSWLEIDKRSGAAGTTSAWADVHDGNVAPSVGVIASMHETNLSTP